MKIGIKLTISFFLVAFVPMVIIGYMAYSKGKEALEKEAFDLLIAAREMKAYQIEDYFQHIHDQVHTFSEDPTIIRAMAEFKESFHSIDTDLGANDGSISGAKERMSSYLRNHFEEKLREAGDDFESLDHLSSHPNTLIVQDLYISSNPHDVGSKFEMFHPGDVSAYSDIHKKYHPFIKQYQEKFKYYDIFLVDDSTGHIVYSVFKEVDFGTSLKDGPFSNANISDAFIESTAAGESRFVELEDFEPYQPSYDQPASFIASPIFDGDEKIGVLIFQMPIDMINNIMTSKEDWKSVGLGATGETYIVGQDHTLRNQSRFLMEDQENYFKLIKEIGTDEKIIDKIRNFHSSIGLQEVRTVGTEAALRGEVGTQHFEDYRGVMVLSAYRPLTIEGMDWVIMSEIDEDEAFIPVRQLKNRIIWGSVGVLILLLIAAFLVSRQITKPLKKLTTSARQLARGNMEVNIGVRRKDEIGILAMSFRKMQTSIGNLISELKDINQNLENKVLQRTEEIQYQKEMVEEKNREIVDSINYAQRLQNAILPPRGKIKKYLRDSFVLFKPKDIVSGDFYWLEVLDDGKVLFAVVDCTGHGVPGAMVSVVGANSLNRCVKEFGLRKPSDILDKLTDLVVETFAVDGAENVRDGMDISLVSLDTETLELEYAGAHNALWIVRADSMELEETKATKQPVGYYEHRVPFVNHQLQLRKGDCIYLSSDGFADQFGGPKGKKLKSSTFKTMMVGIHERSMERQLEILDEEFEKWKGNLEQIDDVCVFGVRV